jgi:hypothetical protein
VSVFRPYASASAPVAGGGQHEPDLIEQQQPAPIDPVGDRAAEQRGRDERHQFDGAEQPNEQSRPRLDVHLIRQCNQRRLRTEA